MAPIVLHTPARHLAKLSWDERKKVYAATFFRDTTLMVDLKCSLVISTSVWNRFLPILRKTPRTSQCYKQGNDAGSLKTWYREASLTEKLLELWHHTFPPIHKDAQRMQHPRINIITRLSTVNRVEVRVKLTKFHGVHDRNVA